MDDDTTVPIICEAASNNLFSRRLVMIDLGEDIIGHVDYAQNIAWS